MRSRLLPFILLGVLLLGIAASFIYLKKFRGNQLSPDYATPSPLSIASPSGSPAPSPLASGNPSALPSGVVASPALAASGLPQPQASLASPGAIEVKGNPGSNLNPDLTADANGLSHATAVIATNYGQIRFKFYPKDAPNTIKRVIELINQGFYNGLPFHQVYPNFLIQTGDPTGKGSGGSGVKLEPEFNNRRHEAGAVAMARFQEDPKSADSQFYITLTPQYRLDRSYTVFGQVVEGLDVAKKIQKGDRINTLIIE